MYAELVRRVLLSACLLWLAGGVPARAGPIPDSLEQRLLACAACHGAHGEGQQINEYYPRIAAKPAGYLFNQLVNFRERRRQSSPVMNYLVEFLSDDYLREIAQHYSKLRPAYPPPRPVSSPEARARGEALMTRGDPARKIPACVACHGDALAGMEPSIPGLVGLDPRYIGAQIGAWRNKLRRAQEPDCMASIASLLEPGDIPAIAAWLASRPVPADAHPLKAGSLLLPMDCGGVNVSK
jgi:cytochrome c553